MSIFKAPALAVRSGSRSAAPDERSPRVVLSALTGVRAVAALWVVMGHFSPIILLLIPGYKVLLPLTCNGFLGVDLFFVLSGFILAHNYHTEFQSVSLPKYRQFLWLRLARMYPVHLLGMFVLLFGVLAGRFAGMSFNMPERLGAMDFFRNLLLVHAWGFADDTSWNGPAWSISGEWFAYLLFPFIMLAVTRIRNERLAILGAGLMYVVLFGMYAIYDTTFDTLDNDLALVRVTTQFIAGCLLYRVYMRGLTPSWRWDALAMLMVAGVVAYSYRFPVEELVSLAPAPLMAVLVLALSSARGPLGWFLATPVMVFGGEVSYSLYMTHDLIRMLLRKLVHVENFTHASLAARLAVLGVYVAAVGVAAIGTFFVVEQPARRWMRSLAGKGRPVEEIATGTIETAAASAG